MQEVLRLEPSLGMGGDCRGVRNFNRWCISTATHVTMYDTETQQPSYHIHSRDFDSVL